MVYLAWLVQFLVLCVMVWMAWPLMLAAAVATACGWALWKALHHLGPVQRWMQRAAVLRMGLRMGVVLVGCGIGCGLLLCLPAAAYDPTVLVLAAGGVAATVVFVACWGLGQAVTSGLQWHRQQPIANQHPGEWWWIAGGVGSVATLLAVALVSPDTAGWLAWREQLLGYPSVQVRIPLKADGTAPSTPAQKQALLQLVQPLLEQGSRSIDRYTRTKHGTNHFQATVAARYRWQGDTLELALGGWLPAQALKPHLQRLQTLATDTPAQQATAPLAWWQMALADCAPDADKGLAMLGRSQRTQAIKYKACVQARMERWQTQGAIVAGHVGEVTVSALPRFSPWRWGSDWQTPVLPAPADLDARAH